MRHAARLMLVSLVAAIICPLFGAAQNIDAVLDQAERALGGRAALADLQSVRIRSHGTWAMPSRDIPPSPYKAEIVFRRPDQFHLKMEFPEELGGTFLFGYDGEDAWSIFGGPPGRCQDWFRETVLSMVLETQLFLVAPARAEYAGDMQLETRLFDEASGTYLVSYHPLSPEKPWSVWFDKETGQLVKLEHGSYQMDGQLVLARITRAAPRDFAGISYASGSRFEAVRDGQIIETADETTDSIELNPKLSADYFACPAWEVDAAAIDVKEVPAETVVKYEHRGPYGEIGKSLGPMLDVIMDAGLVPVGAASGTRLSDPGDTAPEDLRTVLSVRVANVKKGEPELPAGYEFVTQPAMRVAYAYHRGDYANEDEAYGRLRAWMAQQGLKPAGPTRTIWLHDRELTVTDDLVMEVQIPIEQKEQTEAKRVKFNPLPLENQWMNWLVGDWVGSGQSDAGTAHATMHAEMALNGQFLLVSGKAQVTDISTEQRQYLETQLHASEEEIQRFQSSPFKSLELYTIDQETGEIVGYLFDSLRCMATGRGQLQGNLLTMEWQWATGHTSTHITERLSDDSASVVERIAMPDGSTMEESSKMVRKE